MSWLSSKMMKQQSPEQLQQMLMGGGVSQMLDKQQGLYGSMMEGKIPHSMRMNMIGAGQDLAAGDAFNTSSLLSAGGMSPGSGLGAALSKVSSSQRGNEAITQLASLQPQMMKMGMEGMGNVMQTRQGIQGSMAQLDRANMQDRNMMNQQGFGMAAGGLANWLGGTADPNTRGGKMWGLAKTGLGAAFGPMGAAGGSFLEKLFANKSGGNSGGGPW